MPFLSALDLAPGAIIDGSNGFAYFRSSVGTVFNQDDTESTAASGVARYGYVDGQLEGLMMEAPRTNYALRSTDFGNAVWQLFSGATKVGATTLNGENCYRVNLGDNDNSDFNSAGAIYQSIASTGVAGKYWVNIRWAGHGSGQRARVGGIMGAVTANSGTIELPSDRFIVTRVPLENVLTSNAGNISVRPANGYDNNSVLIHSMWLTRGNWADSHIPTAGTTATRDSDGIQFLPNSAGVGDGFFNGSFALLFKYEPFENVGAMQFFVDDNMGNNHAAAPTGLDAACMVIFFDAGIGFYAATQNGIASYINEWQPVEPALYLGGTGAGIESNALNAYLQRIEVWGGDITFAEMEAAQRRRSFLLSGDPLVGRALVGRSLVGRQLVGRPLVGFGSAD